MYFLPRERLRKTSSGPDTLVHVFIEKKALQYCNKQKVYELKIFPPRRHKCLELVLNKKKIHTPKSREKQQTHCANKINIKVEQAQTDGRECKYAKSNYQIICPF